jgi:hypothetical protein
MHLRSAPERNKYDINPNPWSHILLVFSSFSVLFSVRVMISVSKFSRYASNWVCSIENILARGSKSWIDYFGFFYDDFGLRGEMLLSL